MQKASLYESMRVFLAKIFLTALTVLAVFSAYGAEKVTFETHAPLTVAVGEAFRVEFSLVGPPLLSGRFCLALGIPLRSGPGNALLLAK